MKDPRHIFWKSNCAAYAISCQGRNAATYLVLDLPAAALARAQVIPCIEAPHSSSRHCHQLPVATNAATCLPGHLDQ